MSQPLDIIIVERLGSLKSLSVKDFRFEDLFKKCGFVDSKLLWYHYHPAMPFLNGADEALFRDEALKLEHDTTDWRGLFLCSAFVVEAVKPSLDFSKNQS